MKKTAYALTIMLTISIMFGVQFAKLVEANYIPVPSLWVTSSSYYEFSEFEGDVPLSVHVNVANSSDALKSTVISYSIDGADNISLTNLTQHQTWSVDDQPYLVI